MVAVIGAVVASGTRVYAGDLKINLPKGSHFTPVQRLNREGVEAIRKHAYEKAETLIYKAYLLDPDDLNEYRGSDRREDDEKDPQEDGMSADTHALRLYHLEKK